MKYSLIELSGSDREFAIKNLAGAQAILGHAVRKYAGQTKGGLAKAQEMVAAVLERIQPTTLELMDQLDELLLSEAAAPDQYRKAQKILLSLRRSVAAKDRDLLRDLLSEID